MSNILPRLKQMEATKEIQELAKRLSGIDAQISHGADWHANSERIKRWHDAARTVIESYLKPEEQKKLDRAIRNAFSAGGITTDSLHTYLDALLKALSRRPESVLSPNDGDADNTTSTPEPREVADPHNQTLIPEPPPVVADPDKESSIPEAPVAANSYENPLIPEHPLVAPDSYEETPIPEPPVVEDRLIPKTRRVLIIHGHDESNLQTLAGLLSDRYALKPMTLRREPEKGKALIDKFEQAAASCSFAFVLMTPDDEVSAGMGQNAQVRPIALFELGWVCGRMGRDRVCVVSKRGAKIPPDLNGIDRIEFIESVEETVLKLERVLQAADLFTKGRKG